jgi:LmbE family N-acetylglucosaminyl deacetylase
MRTSFREIELRTQALAAATNFFSTVVRPIVIKAPFGASMLVIAPHQDDEVIGCGGAMALQRKAGAAVQTVVLQDGADEHQQVSLTREQLKDLRNAESRAAAEIIGADSPVFLAHKDLVREAETIAEYLACCIESKSIDVIFTPFALDGNVDHRAANKILADALSYIRRDVRILQYEVWANCVPNVAIIIDSVIDDKRDMLGCFRFANSALNYLHATIGLNMYHSRMLPAGAAQYVEAYFETPKDEYLALIKALVMAERVG